MKYDSLKLEYEKAGSDTSRIKILFQLGYLFLNGPSDSLIYYFSKSLELSGKNILLLEKQGVTKDNLLLVKYKKLKIRALIEVGIEYFYQGDYPKALSVFNTALDISKEINDVELLSECYSEIAIVYKNRGEYDNAIDYHKKSLFYAEKSKDTSWIASCLVNIGTVYYKKGFFRLALDNYFKALKIFERLKQKRRMESCYLNIGKIYKEQNDFDKALSYFHKALELATEENEKVGEANCYLNIGDIFAEKQQYDTARKYLQKSVGIKKQLGYRFGLDDCYISIGNTYKDEGKLTQALTFFSKAFKISTEENDKPGIAKSLNSEACVFFLQKQYGKALSLALEALEIARETGNLKAKKDIYLLISNIYENMGETKPALKYFKLYSNIKDSLFNESKYHTIREIETKFETEKKEQQMALLTEKNRIQGLKIAQRNRLIWAFWIFFSLSVTAIYLYFRNRRLKEKHKNIDLEQRLLRSQMNPHFIFNSLIAIQSFIYKNETIMAGDYLAKFAGLIRKILEYSRVDLITLKDEVNTLELYLELQDLRFNNTFDYKIEVDSAIDTESVKLPPMLTQPFIENAIEHGLRYKKSRGMLYAGFFKDNGFLKLIVEDNGVGRKKAKELEKNRKRKSLAMEILKERIGVLGKKFNGRFVLSIEDLYDINGEPAGTRIVLTMPVDKIMEK